MKLRQLVDPTSEWLARRGIAVMIAGGLVAAIGIAGFVGLLFVDAQLFDRVAKGMLAATGVALVLRFVLGRRAVFAWLLLCSTVAGVSGILIVVSLAAYVLHIHRELSWATLRWVVRVAVLVAGCTVPAFVILTQRTRPRVSNEPLLAEAVDPEDDDSWDGLDDEEDDDDWRTMASTSSWEAERPCPK
jgi:MFS family permease